jgi:hypothetical protein
MIGILYTKLVFLLVITFVSVNYGLVTRHQLKTVVRYLGEDYYLKDGCPLPDCDDSERGCFKRQIELKKKFNGCYSGSAGKEMGCIDIGRGIQIPVFAKYCSKLCYYDGDVAKQSEIIYCPHNGTRHDEVDRIVQREMLRKNPTTTTTTERTIENPDRTIGLSTLIVPDRNNQVDSRNQVFGLRPVSFGRFDRPQRRRTTSARPSFINHSNRTPRGQNTQLDKTIHELIQEGFFDSPNNFPRVTEKSTERPSLLQTSTSIPFTTPSLSTKAIENVNVEDVIEENKDTKVSDEHNNKIQAPPIADASLLLQLNEPEEGSADWSLKTASTVSSQ